MARAENPEKPKKSKDNRINNQTAGDRINTAKVEMKKIIFAMILMMGVCITTTSCTKEKSLNGTTWNASQSYSSYTANFTLSFYESTFTLDERDSDGDFYTTTGNYTYNDPIVTLFRPDEGNISGTVSGDHIVIGGMDFIKRK